MRHRSIAELIPSFDQIDPIVVEEVLAGEPEITPIELPSFLARTQREPDPVEPAIDVDAVFENGRKAGLAEAETAMQAALAEARAEAEANLQAARRIWVAAEAEALAALVETRLATIETRIADKAGRLIAPFIGERMREQVLDALADQIRPLLRGDDDRSPIRMAGPDDLLDALKTRLGDHPRLAIESNGAPEVTILVADSEIESRMGRWIAAIREAVAAPATEPEPK